MLKSSTRRELKLKKDHDPFLNFYGYDQKRVDAEYYNHDQAPLRPLATLVKYENGKPMDFSQEIRKTLEKYHDIDLTDDDVLDKLIDMFDPKKGWASKET